MSGGPKLAELVFEKLYGRKVQHDIAGDMVVMDEYKGWIPKAPPYVIYIILPRYSPPALGAYLPYKPKSIVPYHV